MPSSLGKISDRALLLAIVLSMFIWGTSWSSAKVLSGYGNAASIAFIRFLFTIVSLLFILSFFKIEMKIKPKGFPFVLGAGVFMFLYALCFFKGLQLGLPGAGGVLVTTLNPIFAYLVGLIVSRVIPGKIELLGLIIGILAGTIILNLWGRIDAVFSFGNTYFLLAAFVWALMSKLSSHANTFGNSVSFSFWMHLVSLVGLAFAADLSEVLNILKTGDSKFWLNIVYFSTLNSGFATTCYLFAAARLGAEKASTFIFIVPSAAVLSSWLFLNETVKMNTVVGGILGVLAVLIINGSFKQLKRKSD